MHWLRRILWPFPRKGQWPLGVPPTAPGDGPVQFHCPACRVPVEAKATRCPLCDAHLLAKP